MSEAVATRIICESVGDSAACSRYLCVLGSGAGEESRLSASSSRSRKLSCVRDGCCSPPGGR
eukprot:2116635-Prymnesium_polylepis.1